MTPEEELAEQRRRAMQALGGLEAGEGIDPSIGGAPDPRGVFTEDEAVAGERTLGVRPPAPPPAPAAPAPPTERAPAGASRPVDYAQVALGREDASLPRPRQPAQAPAQAATETPDPWRAEGKPPIGEPNLPPGQLPQNPESALRLSADAPGVSRSAHAERAAPRERRDRGGGGGVFSPRVGRILNALLTRGEGDSYFADLQAKEAARPAERRAEARQRAMQQAQMRAQQATTTRSDRELALREQAQQRAQERQGRADTDEAALRDPSSPASRSAQGNLRALIAASGIPALQESMTPESIGAMSAADIQNSRDPILRALATTVVSGQTHQNRTDEIGQQHAGRQALQTERLASEDAREGARNANRLEIARLRARRRGAGGGGGGVLGGASERVLRDIVRRGQISGGMHEDLAEAYADSLRGPSLTRLAEATGRAVLSAGPTGTQARSDRTVEIARSRARESMIPVRNGVQRARALAESATPEEIQAAIWAVNHPDIAGAASMIGAGGAMPGNLTPRARELAQAIAGFANPLIRDISGAQVTPNEFPRLQQQFGVGQFSTPVLLVRALDQAAQMLDERDAALDAPLQGEARPNPLAEPRRAGGAQAPTQGAQQPAQGPVRTAIRGHYYLVNGQRRQWRGADGAPLPAGAREVQ